MKLCKILSLMYYYIVAHIILIFHYDRKYIKGRWFTGKMFGINKPGWKWIVKDYKSCKREGVNLDVPWPVSSRILILDHTKIHFHPDNLDNFQMFGNYFQSMGDIYIGRGTYISANVGIITSNHNNEDLNKHENAKTVKIGKNCWIAMNSMILPGVELGDNTIVGAGSIVTKSFKDGHCVIAGNPAKIIRKLGNNSKDV